MIVKRKSRAASPPARDDAHPMIDVREVADFLRVSEKTVWRLAAEGRLPHPVRVGRQFRWRRAAIERWTAGQ